jgi:hypothetical protein
MNINGNYFAKSITTSGADQDLITTMKTTLAITDALIAKKITLISLSNFTVSVNGVGYSDVFLDVDNLYKLSLDGIDVSISSLKIHESGIALFFAMVF